MTPLLGHLRELIAGEGPVTVERYMALALGHPTFGYYAMRDPFGRAGDFVTAPEISQMFGEMVGLWAAEVWIALGRPAEIALVEAGPGRGTLMADALRAARALPAFRAAIRLHLVETSPVLRACQGERLASTGIPIAWHARLDDVPDGPAIVVANEFLDALPIRQFVRRDGAWHERLVGLGPDGGLAFGLAPGPEPRLRQAGQEGDVLEVGEVGLALVAGLARRLVQDRGAALLIDYGHGRSGTGDTLQAVAGHRHVDPLGRPGEADLTAHVDFAAVARVAAAAGAAVHGPVGQGRFLRDLGIETRAARLASGAATEAARAIGLARDRLVGEGEGEMGSLFKAIGLSWPGLGSLPGLPPAIRVTAASGLRREMASC